MEKENQTYQILLYYKYIKIDNPNQLMKEQRNLCEMLNIKGRIIIANEGINGTIEGTKEATEKYIEEMTRDNRFNDINFKKSKGIGDAFPRLSIKVRPEIVTLKLGKDDINPNELTGDRLTAEELHKWYEEKKDFIMVDMRNDYEFEIGRFKDSIHPKLKNFRDLAPMINELKEYKDKTVVTCCTGGVRCEKASGLLKKAGFKDVHQLHDGMVTYMEKYPAQDFQGSLYVFDKRQSMYFEDDNKHKIISACNHCGEKSERIRNCADVKCNKKFIGCEKCAKEDRTRVCHRCERKTKIG